NDLIVKGELPQGEGRRILEELQEKGRGKQETWSAQFQKEIASSLKKLGFVTEERFRELEQQLQRLEAKLDNLVGQQEQGHLATQTNTAPDNAENDDESRS
ncbi:phasin family protein, partial [Escherichia coli]|uniref:phasin family protein n=1 Tax=Escherichia coli TaxID=562 RepID=UPI001BDD31F3